MAVMKTIAISINNFNEIPDESKFLIYKECCQEYDACNELDNIFKIILKYTDIAPTYNLSVNVG